MGMVEEVQSSRDEAMNDASSFIVSTWDLFIKITDMILRLLNAAFFLMIAWFTIKEWKK